MRLKTYTDPAQICGNLTLSRFRSILSRSALVLCLFISGCASPQSEPQRRAPVEMEVINLKSIPRGEFSMTRQEEDAARRVFRRLRAHILFEIVVNRIGNIEKIRVVTSLHDDFMTTTFRNKVASIQFQPARPSDPMPFRTFFYPLKTESSLEIY